MRSKPELTSRTALSRFRRAVSFVEDKLRDGSW